MRNNRIHMPWKIGLVLCGAAILFWLAASTPAQLPNDEPETVLVTFHVQKGHEDEMKQTLAQAWQAYRKADMVFAEPHVVLQGTEDGGKPYFVEIFTWRDRDIPDHMPPNVQAIWKQMGVLCEKRDNKTPIEGGEMRLITPANKD